MGGLSAAIYARLAGHSVLVLERSTAPGGKAAGIEIQGYQLDPGPSIIILTRLYEAVFRDAGRSMSDYLQFDRLDVISRVYFGAEPPIDLPRDEDACFALLHDMNPADARRLKQVFGKIESVESTLDQTIYDHPFERPIDLMHPALLRFGMKFNPLKTYKRMVDEMFTLPLLRAFFYGFPSYGGQSYHAKAPGAFMIPYYMMREGVYFPQGGVRAIPFAFAKLASELGVEFRYGADVVGVESESGRVKSLKLGSGERIESEWVISNLDRSRFSGLMGAPVTEPPSFSYFTAHWGVGQEIPGLEHHNLFIPTDFESGFRELYDHSRFPTHPIVYLNATHHLDPAAAPTGCSNLFAVVTAPAAVDGIDWAADSPGYVDRVRSVLRDAGCEWSTADIQFERIQNPLYFAHAHGNYLGSLYGLSEGHRLWGMFPATNTDPRWPNVVFCGGSVQPGAGLPMVTLSGKFAARALVPN